MKTLLPVIVEELQAGRSVGLATVLQSKGSAPRGAGACQLLLQNGRSVGTVGGGKLERRALDELQLLLDADVASVGAAVRIAAAPNAENHFEVQSCSKLEDYALTPNEAQSLGMVCGGNVSMAYQLLVVPMLPLFLELNEHLGQNLWLLRKMSNGAIDWFGWTNGDLTPPALTVDDVVAHCTRKPELFGASANENWFFEPVILHSHTYIFGCGHVAQCVAPLLAQLDYSPIVYDDRAEFANEALFPSASEVICAPFEQASERLNITEDDEIVIMTRGHVNDWLILSQALRTPAYYVGLIGSRTKVAQTHKMLLEKGFTQEDLKRVRSPIGVPILAETPMEIAVSVAGEMIRCRAERAQGVALS